MCTSSLTSPIVQAPGRVWTVAKLSRVSGRLAMLAVCWLVAALPFFSTSVWAQSCAAGISASTTSINAGGSTTLTWTTFNCTSADLNGTTVALNGSQVVLPAVTTTYRITGHGANGTTDWGQVTITVNSASGPTASITANPTSITSGASSTLTWSSTNATSATLNGTAVAISGSQTVTPAATTTYTFIAKSSSGTTASSSATVTVGSGGPCTAGISADTTSISAGGSATLTWTTFNCATADLNGTNVALNGSQVVSPTTTTTYRITGHSSTGATDWGQVTITVSGSGSGPTASITANPTSITSGQSATLTWSSSGATSATLNGASVAINGSQTVSPSSTTTYTFVATSSGGATATSNATVIVSSGSGSASTMGQWTSVQTWPWMAAHAHLLPNGKVIFWPSFGNGNNPTLWDPVANTFASAPQASYNIFCSGHAFLQDGRLFLAGGHAGNNSDGLIYTTVYDPSKNTWTQTSNMNDARWYPTNTTLPNGDVLVVSGYTVTGTYNTLPQVWSPSTNSFRNLTSAQLMQALYPWMFVAPNGKVFNAGDADDVQTSAITSRYLDTSGTGAWSSVATYKYAGLRDYGSAVMFDGKVMVAGGDGANAGQSATNTAEIIDLNSSSPAYNYTGSLNTARRQLNLTLLPDGKILATGGSAGGGFDNQNSPIYNAEMWDPATGKWANMASISTYRGYHSTALLLPDGRVLSAGGEQTGASAEIYSPPYLFKGARPTISSVSATTVKYGQAITVNTPDATSISQVTFIRLGSVTHGFNMNQRLNHLQFTQVSGGLQVTTPANGNLAPPGNYMLFIVNSNGVPSVASMIKIGN